MFRRRVTRMRRRLPIRRRRIFRKRHFRRRFNKRKLNVHHFKTTYVGPIITSSITPVTGTISVEPGNLPEFTSLQGVFDLLRINKVVVKFVPSGNVHEANTTSAPAQPCQIHTAIQHVDTGAPAGVSSLISYPNYRNFSSWRTFSRTFVPALRLDADGQASACPKFKQWVRIDPSFGGVVDYVGLSFAVDAFATGSFSMQTYITVFYSCKEKN